jgi:hypothetical protein
MAVKRVQYAFTRVILVRGVDMLFKKLFQVLVLGGAVIGTTSACTPSAEAQTAAPKKGGMRDGGTMPDAGTSAKSGGGAAGW